MARLFNTFTEGGPIMWPLLGLSIATFACALERGWFWYQLMTKEDRIVHDVLEAARYDLEKAAAIAEQAQLLPIGRFLLAPLRLKKPNPETFRLAMESAADKEFIQMRKGDKLLETVVALAPLLGLLGTVTGLITTFGSLDIGKGSASNSSNATKGIGEALIATATGMMVAILALVFFRIFVTLQARQVDYFAEVGTELELIYRQLWYEEKQPNRNSALSDGSSESSLTADRHN